MMGVTQRQHVVLDFLRRCDRSPTFAEIMVGTGLRSRSQVHAILQRLEQRGFIRRTPNIARSIELTDRVPAPSQPDLGTVSSTALVAELKRRGIWTGRAA